MSYECHAMEQPRQPVLSMRARTPVQALPQFLGRAYGTIAGYLAEMGEQPAGEPFAAFHNLDMQDLDVEAGFPVARDLPGRGEVAAGEIAAGRSATCLYVGPYSDCEPAYAALSRWITENGYEATGVAYEFYLSEPDTPPQDTKTRIVLPLKGA